MNDELSTSNSPNTRVISNPHSSIADATNKGSELLSEKEQAEDVALVTTLLQSSDLPVTSELVSFVYSRLQGCRRDGTLKFISESFRNEEARAKLDSLFSHHCAEQLRRAEAERRRKEQVCEQFSTVAVEAQRGKLALLIPKATIDGKHVRYHNNQVVTSDGLSREHGKYIVEKRSGAEEWKKIGGEQTARPRPANKGPSRKQREAQQGSA